MRARVDELLSAETIGDYLAGRGLLAAGQPQASELAGGISNIVLAVGACERAPRRQAGAAPPAADPAVPAPVGLNLATWHESGPSAHAGQVKVGW